MTQFISAKTYASESIRNVMMEALWVFLSFVSPVFELIIGDYSTSEFFFAKILLLFLLIIICKFALDKTPIGEAGNGKFSIILSVIVSILAIRFISDNELIQGILIPYGTLGVAITTILPLIIFFYFVHYSNVGTFGRKFFWGVFLIVLLVLWLSKYNELGIIANQIYALVLLLTIALLIFDKTVHHYLGMSDIKKYERERKKESEIKLRRDLHELNDDFSKGIVNKKEYIKYKKAIISKINELREE